MDCARLLLGFAVDGPRSSEILVRKNRQKTIPGGREPDLSVLAARPTLAW
jgi:hypothetical protein